MRGIPTVLNTREDYEYLKENFDKDVWVPKFQELFDTSFMWVFERDLQPNEPDLVDDNVRKMQVSVDPESGKTVRSIYLFRPNNNCKLLQIGYTREEVENIIASA